MKGIQWIVLMAVLFIACNPNSNSNGHVMKDQELTFIGTARNGKGNALVVTKEGVAYYIDRLDAWETAVEGREISVTGILTIETLKEEDLKNEQGEWKQGVTGDRKIISKARWQLTTK